MVLKEIWGREAKVIVTRTPGHQAEGPSHARVQAEKNDTSSLRAVTSHYLLLSLASCSDKSMGLLVSVFV